MPKKRNDPVDQHVGSRVRMRRMMLEISQTTLANKIGVTFQQVQKYEKGTNRIGSSRLQKIATVLTVPINFFFEGQPGATLEENHVTPTLSEVETKIVIDLKGLTPQQKEWILKIVRAFKS